MTNKRTARIKHPWHTLTSEQIYGALDSGRDGLTSSEADRRLVEHGYNEIEMGRRVSAIAVFFAQFKSVLILILLVTIGISAYLDHMVEAVVIGVIVLLTVFLGFIQEYRAERAMEALQRIAAPTALVLRDGSFAEMPAHRLVPGDIVRLQTGNQVPADIRLTEAVNLQINEATLTGESAPVEKQIEAFADPGLSIGDRLNLAYAGTTISYGRGTGIVVATGMGTEFGRIVQLLDTAVPQETPLQRSLNRVGHVLALVALVVMAAIVALGIWRGEPLYEMLLFGIALAVAVVPEALPAVVTISLAIGTRRMIKRNALIRRLPAVETLGSTAVICADKTGTLTKDEMTVRMLWLAGQTLNITGVGYEPAGRIMTNGSDVGLTPPLSDLLQAMVLVNDAVLVCKEPRQWAIQGDPTEGALLVAAAKAGIDKADLEQRLPRVSEIPFTSEKCVATS